MHSVELSSPEGRRYLSGQLFTEYGRFTISANSRTYARIDCIRRVVADCNILHIGFCDHQPLIRERIAQDLWLHNHLIEVGKRCVGVDIDEEAVENVRGVTNLEDIYVTDVTKPGSNVIMGDQWDVAVFADVIEHVPDPSIFLRSFLDHYHAHVKKVLISIPNAQRIGMVKGALGNFETINSDHKNEYTPFTLSKLVIGAGLTPLEFYYVSYNEVSSPKRAFLNLFPRFSDGMIMVAEVQ